MPADPVGPRLSPERPRIGGPVHGLDRFYMNDGNAWVMHSELGWLYPMASGKTESGCGRNNWAGCGRMKHFIHSFTRIHSAGWLYFYGASQDRLLFYHYRDERWLQMNKGGDTQ